VRLTIQRVRDARVVVDGQTVGEIGVGLVVFVGVGKHDTAEDVAVAVRKISESRLFESESGKGFDRSVVEVGGSVLLVSQFTLYGDLRKGRRPAFDDAAPPEQARLIYDALLAALRATGLHVETGTFRAMMQVMLVNDGPVTVLVDTARTF
jgi:D-aminoacyl-tRNA deacylase